MKKILGILIIILISFTINVNAEETPEFGVRYVVTSATGEKYKTFDLDDAKSKVKEALIFEGNTNSNGEIVLDNIVENTELKIVDVQTNKEYKKTVGKEKVVIVRNTVSKNPKTRSTLIVTSFLLITTLSATILLKKNKKLLTVFLLIAALSLIPQVKAESQTIKMIDTNGNILKNQPVKIYAESKLSYEEVKVTINYDLSKTIYEYSTDNCEGKTTFIDGTRKKQIVYKWSLSEKEWVPENDVDLTYVYATWDDDHWNLFDKCRDYDKKREVNSLTGYYYDYRKDQKVVLSLNNIGKIDILDTQNTTGLASLASDDLFPRFNLPVYNELLEDANITAYQIQRICSL